MIYYRFSWISGALFGFEWSSPHLYIAFGIFDLLLVWKEDDGTDS